MKYLVLAALLFTARPAVTDAQPAVSASVSGTVTDRETGHPLQGAHVFLAATMIGTVTNDQGVFRLEGARPGAYKLVVSMLGFEQESRDVFVRDTTGLTEDFDLEPAIIEIGELTVEARQDRRWKSRLNRFERFFLGESEYADQTEIINPEVLDFEATWWGKFVARASAPLVIENRALGYRLQYFLKEFSKEGSTIRYDGEPLFEELEPESPAQADTWHANRLSSYYGSFRHFLLALLRDSTKDEGFVLYRIPSVDDINRSNRRFGVTPRKLVTPGADSSQRTLEFLGLIEITYIKEEETESFLRWQHASPMRRPSNQRSWIRLSDGPTPVDTNGEVIDPYGVTVYGYFAFERVAHELPKEYRPPEPNF